MEDIEFMKVSGVLSGESLTFMDGDTEVASLKVDDFIPPFLFDHEHLPCLLALTISKPNPIRLCSPTMGLLNQWWRRLSRAVVCHHSVPHMRHEVMGEPPQEVKIKGVLTGEDPTAESTTTTSTTSTSPHRATEKLPYCSEEQLSSRERVQRFIASLETVMKDLDKTEEDLNRFSNPVSKPPKQPTVDLSEKGESDDESAEEAAASEAPKEFKKPPTEPPEEPKEKTITIHIENVETPEVEKSKET
ncbi:MAG: hypothetical protein KVP17_003952 [Porospora cf. gigantea B]|uniref:uncharacterized protein n=1 Tax=Porospora cf. gigantea B TaxID=2853592 RepID=UPI003571E0DF|nr:MAG: hypothetical protein KVP17_003952 [Porospora cf. gigantea B]